MGLPVFKSDFSSKEQRKVAEVRAELTPAFRLGVSKLLPFPSKETATLGRLVLFGKSRSVSGRLGLIHPFFQGQANPSTLEGLDSLVGRLCLGGLKSVRDFELQVYEGSAVVSGGPVSTHEARLIFGTGGASPLLGVSLPFSFRYWDRIDEAVKSRTEPWELVVDGVAAPGVKECLIVTVLPMGDKDKIVSIAGLHGAGTRAIDLVLKNQELLEKIERESRFFVGWQLFVEVESRGGEKPLNIGAAEVREIKGADFDDLRYHTRGQLLLRSEEASLDKSGALGIESHTGNIPSVRSSSERSEEGALTAAPHQERKSMSNPSKNGPNAAVPVPASEGTQSRLGDALCDLILEMRDEHLVVVAEEDGGVAELAEKFDKIRRTRGAN